MGIYDYPLYYEIAFSFINPKKQVDNFEKLIKKFSKTKVKRFLDIACGPGLQLREIARRGYEAIGLDINPKMLQYLKEKSEEEGLRVETVKADMTKFKLKKKVDFAFIMMGSFCFKSNENLLSHLNSVADSLNKGGIYLIQNMSLNWTKAEKQSWTRKRDGITVKTIFEWNFKNIINQIYTEKIILEVNDNGERKKFIEKEDLKFIFPQEFKALIKLNGKFEFLGWWEGNRDSWHLDKPLEKANKLSNNIVLLRRN
jgi:SAM-dependent methyltransferase